MCSVWGAVAYGAVTLISGIIDRASQPDPTPPPAPIIQSIQPQVTSSVQYAQNANESAMADMERLNAQAEEIVDKSDQDEMTRMRQGLREAALKRVRYASAGVGGNVLDTALYDSEFQTGMDLGVIKQNTANRLSQVDATAKAVNAQTQSRINQAESAVTQAYVDQQYKLQAANAQQGYWNKTVGSSSNPLMDYLKIGAKSVQSGMSAYSAGVGVK